MSNGRFSICLTQINIILERKKKARTLQPLSGVQVYGTAAKNGVNLTNFKLVEAYVYTMCNICCFFDNLFGGFYSTFLYFKLYNNLSL